MLLPNWPPEREPNCVLGSPCWLHPAWMILGLMTSEQKSVASVFSSCAQCPQKMLLLQQRWLQIMEIDLKTCSCLSELTTAAAHLFFALKNFPQGAGIEHRVWLGHWQLNISPAEWSRARRRLWSPWCSYVGSERPWRQENTKQGFPLIVNRLGAQGRWQTLICGISEPQSHGHYIYHGYINSYRLRIRELNYSHGENPRDHKRHEAGSWYQTAGLILWIILIVLHAGNRRNVFILV